MPTLLIMKGAAVDLRVPLPGVGGRLVLGRGRNNDVVLDDHAMLVSRRHAEIRASASGYTVIDLDSENGVWRCGTRVAGVALETLEPIVIGPYRLLLAEVDVDVDPPTIASQAYVARDETIAPPNLPSPGSAAAVLIGAGLLIAMIAGALVVWLLWSAWASLSAARSVEGGERAVVAMVAPATCVHAPDMTCDASDACREEPA